MKLIFYFSIILLLFGSCKSISQAKRLENCDFAFSHVSDTELGGVKIQDKEEFKDLSFSQMGLISKAFLMNDLDLTFTAHVEIRNPNKKMAALNKLDWKMYVENEEIASGTIDKRFEVQGGSTASVPVKVDLDVIEIWKSNNRDNVLNLLFNLADVGGRPTLLTIKVRPAIMIAGREVQTPNYFTINSEFGD